MKIVFLLPGHSLNPIGGFKAIYQFANGLASRGHEVVVVHPASTSPPARLADRLRRSLWPALQRMRYPDVVRWFPVDEAVELRLVPGLAARWLPDADALVGTCWQTAAAVAALPNRKGRKLWLVADYEYWSTSDTASRVVMTRAFQEPGIELVSYGPVVTAMLGTCGRKPVAEIHVGADLDVYRAEAPLDQRPWGRVGFPARIEAFKGTADAIAAASLLRSRHENLSIRTFGRVDPISIPHWIHYWRDPSDVELRAFYNQLSIFVLPSHYEAWPLPGLEAMACGAALVAADSGGVRGYARHGDNALIVPKERPDLLAEAIEELLRDESLRRALARSGHAEANSLLWSSAVSALEAVLFAPPASAA